MFAFSNGKKAEENVFSAINLRGSSKIKHEISKINWTFILTPTLLHVNNERFSLFLDVASNFF